MIGYNQEIKKRLRIRQDKERQVMKRNTKKYPFAVFTTAFHGGGMVSQHETLEAAYKASRAYGSKDCLCGCAGVVNADDKKLSIETGDFPGEVYVYAVADEPIQTKDEYMMHYATICK
jgi:hypothetical protein